jgi:hypothetical protein
LVAAPIHLGVREGIFMELKSSGDDIQVNMFKIMSESALK